MNKRPTEPYKIRGVEALFGSESEPSASDSQTLALDQIVLPSYHQPRRHFDPISLEQLATSIQQHGIWEPLLVRQHPSNPSRYELVAGERRYRAAQQIQLSKVPVRILTLTDEEALLVSLEENLYREDLNPFEETLGILDWLAVRVGVSVEEVKSTLYQMNNVAKGAVNQNVLVSELSDAIQTGFEELNLISWQSFVSSRLPLLKLPFEILEALQNGELAYTKATAIARIKDEKLRGEILHAAIEQKLSLNQIKEKIAQLTKPAQSIIANSPKGRLQDVVRKVSSSEVWKDPKKWKKVEALLVKLEALVESESMNGSEGSQPEETQGGREA